jgi:hypothetical protein
LLADHCDLNNAALEERREAVPAAARPRNNASGLDVPGLGLANMFSW